MFSVSQALRCLAYVSLAFFCLCCSASRSQHTEPGETDEDVSPTTSEQRCCCDDDYYFPPQCRAVSSNELKKTNRFHRLFRGRPYRCPKIELFDDGLPARQTYHGASKAAGCDAPVGLSLKELLKDVAAEEKDGMQVDMPILSNVRFVMLFDTMEGGEKQVELRRNAVMLSASWKVEMIKQSFNTQTGRPRYQIFFRGGWTDREPQEFIVSMDKILKISQRTVEGKTALEFELDNDWRLFLVPFSDEPLRINLGQFPGLFLQSSSAEDPVLRPIAALHHAGTASRICCCAQGHDHVHESDNTLEGQPCKLAVFCDHEEVRSPVGCAAASETEAERVAMRAADELGQQLVKAKMLSRGSGVKVPSGRNGGPQVLFQELVPTEMQCHSAGALQDFMEGNDHWRGIGAKVATFKAPSAEERQGGISSFLRDVWGRHQHVKIGNGKSCIDLVQSGATLSDMSKAGCTPYRSKAAMVAVVRECLDTASAVEAAILHSWSVTLKAYVKTKKVSALLEEHGYSPSKSWQKLLAGDSERIEALRKASLALDMQANRVGVWGILQRASVYAYRFANDPANYLARINQKLDEVDKHFWEMMRRPGDGHVYPHGYNSVSPRDVLSNARYQELLSDNSTVEEIVSILEENGYAQDAKGFDKAKQECMRSSRCAESPLLLKLMTDGPSNETLWKNVPVGWLAALGQAPKMHPTPPKSSSLIFPRPAKAIFGQCFVAPREAIESARELFQKLREQVNSKRWLKGSAKEILSPQVGSHGTPRSLVGDEILDTLDETLQSAASTDSWLLSSAGIQGALACYPTLFGSLGMELELRDETGYNKGGKRSEDQEQVLGQCQVAPHCARLAVERLLHFNQRKWSMLSAVRNMWRNPTRVCKPYATEDANCQVFAGCFQWEVNELCKEFPACCDHEGPGHICGPPSNHTTGLTDDIRTVLGW